MNLTEQPPKNKIRTQEEIDMERENLQRQLGETRKLAEALLAKKEISTSGANSNTEVEPIQDENDLTHKENEMQEILKREPDELDKEFEKNKKDKKINKQKKEKNKTRRINAEENEISSILEEIKTEEPSKKTPEIIIEPENEVVEQASITPETKPEVNENEKTTKTPEEPTPIIPETKPEVNENKKIIEPSQDEVKKTYTILSFGNKGLWKGTSLGAKNIISYMYRGLSKISLINRLTAKIGIAHNQFWINKKENQGFALKEKLFHLENTKDILDSEREQIRKIKEHFEKEGFGYSKSFLKESQKQSKRLAELEDKIKEVEDKLEKKKASIEDYTEKRDAIADGIIRKYDKKLSPIEGKLKGLENYKNKVELYCMGGEAKIEESLGKIEDLEQMRNDFVEKYISLGYSDRQINKAPQIKEIQKIIDSKHVEIEIMRVKIEERKNKINKRIGIIKKKAEPYIKIKNKFEKVKENKSSLIKEEILTEEVELGETTKQEKEKEEVISKENEIKQKTTTIEGRTSLKEDLDDLIKNFNILVENESYPDDEKIDLEDFIYSTGLNATTRISADRFKKILRKYYEVKGVPLYDYEYLINNFV